MKKTSKIKEISFTRTFEGKGGTMYVYSAKLENGEWGDINVKTENKYKAGDEITYELNSREYNGKVYWKIDIEYEKAGFGGFKSSTDRERSIQRQSCLERAVELHIANKISYEGILKQAEQFENWLNR